MRTASLPHDPLWDAYLRGDLRAWTEAERAGMRRLAAYGAEFNKATQTAQGPRKFRRSDTGAAGGDVKGK